MSKEYSEIPLGPQPDRHRPGPIKLNYDAQRTWNQGEHVVSVIGKLTGNPINVRHQFGRGIPADSPLLKTNDEETED